jgi:hypothetical protein
MYRPLLSPRPLVSVLIGSGTIPVLLLAGSLALNVSLGWQVQRLKSMTTVRSAPPPVVTGKVIPELGVKDLDGHKVTLNWASDPRPTVLYIFTPQCHWCQRNLANLKALVSLRGTAYHFVALSITEDGVKTYVAEAGLRVPVYQTADVKPIRDVGLVGTPYMVLVSSTGTVVKAWRGAFIGRIQKDVEGVFNVQLPGLTAE